MQKGSVQNVSENISHPERSWDVRNTAFRTLMILGFFLLISCLILTTLNVADAQFGVVMAIGWSVLWYFVARSIHAHPHYVFGPANKLTTFRAGLVILLGANLVGINHASDLEMWIMSTIAALALVLDGVDGLAARATGLESDFGARYDMEVDAALGCVMALAIWRSGEIGIWILALGFMRYSFVALSYLLPSLRQKLPDSFRRKFVCVIQIGVLVAILTPLVSPPSADWLGLVALALLGASFSIDSIWLLTRASR